LVQTFRQDLKHFRDSLKLSKQENAQIVEAAQLELWKQFFEGCSPAFKQKKGIQSHEFGGASATIM
jgi:hypothetical protein